MALHTTCENFRAEIARHMLTRQAIAELIDMNYDQLTNYINGNIVLPGWAAHNIGWGINEAVQYRIFDVDQNHGPITPRRGRPPGSVKDTPSLEPYQRKRRRRKNRE